MALTQRELIDPPVMPNVQRLQSLDVFRGATIAGMILVNNPGSWSHIYPPLRHAEWHGVTPTDLIFPFFLFIVGVAIPFALAARRARLGDQDDIAPLVRKIFLRSAALFGIGLLLHMIPTRLPSSDSSGNGFFDMQNLRIMGVLQRIALCYLAAGMLSVLFSWRGLLAWAMVLMTVYSVLILAVPVPGNGAGDLSIEGNLATHIDSAVFGTHNYRTLRAGELYWEPEGLLSTLPAIGTTLLGALTGLWLRSGRGAMQKAAGLFAAGVVCAVLGYVLDGLLMPINKGLWTPAYVFLTAGFALLGLGLCYWLIDVHRYQKWSKLLMIFGMNALAMFVLAAIVSRVMVLIAWADEEGKRVALRGFLYNTLYTPLFKDPKNASLAWAISYVLVFLLIALALYRKRIFIKV